jgi:hypothetical protein
VLTTTSQPLSSIISTSITFTTPFISAASTTNDPSSAPSSSSSVLSSPKTAAISSPTRMPVQVIVGIAVGSVIGLLGLILVSLWCLRRRRRLEKFYRRPSFGYAEDFVFEPVVLASANAPRGLSHLRSRSLSTLQETPANGYSGKSGHDTAELGGGVEAGSGSSIIPDMLPSSVQTYAHQQAFTDQVSTPFSNPTARQQFPDSAAMKVDPSTFPLPAHIPLQPAIQPMPKRVSRVRSDHTGTALSIAESASVLSYVDWPSGASSSHGSQSSMIRQPSSASSVHTRRATSPSPKNPFRLRGLASPIADEEPSSTLTLVE